LNKRCYWKKQKQKKKKICTDRERERERERELYLGGWEFTVIFKRMSVIYGRFFTGSMCCAMQCSVERALKWAVWDVIGFDFLNLALYSKIPDNLTIVFHILMNFNEIAEDLSWIYQNFEIKKPNSEVLVGYQLGRVWLDIELTLKLELEPQLKSKLWTHYIKIKKKLWNWPNNASHC